MWLVYLNAARLLPGCSRAGACTDRYKLVRNKCEVILIRLYGYNNDPEQMTFLGKGGLVSEDCGVESDSVSSYRWSHVS